MKMNKYEAMFILKPDLPDEEKKALFSQINEAIIKNKGDIASAAVWAERKKLFFALKKYQEGLYYLVNFAVQPQAVKEIRHAYGLNENIFRVLITQAE